MEPPACDPSNFVGLVYRSSGYISSTTDIGFRDSILSKRRNASSQPTTLDLRLPAGFATIDMPHGNYAEEFEFLLGAPSPSASPTPASLTATFYFSYLTLTTVWRIESHRIAKVRRAAYGDASIESFNMVAQPPDEFLIPLFLAAAAATLAELGFVADEHDFAPYCDTLRTHYLAIEQTLAARGNAIHLLPGFVKHERAGYAYFIYDSNRFAEQSADSTAVAAGLDQRYA